MTDDFIEPGRFAVFVFFKHNNKLERMRIGNFATLEEARERALDNERELRSPNTYGGLIGWPKDRGGRTYRIFEATGWTERPLTEAKRRR